MSDASDFTGVSAGPTQLLASGKVVNSGAGSTWTATIPISSVPQTTRSLLLMLNWDAANSGNTLINSVTVQGSTSKLKWSSGAVPVLSDFGSVIIGLGEATMPVYVPYYGLVDPAGVITVVNTVQGTWNYWLLALPDADLLGSGANPISVVNPPYPSLLPPAYAPMVVELGAGTPGTISNPMYVQQPTPAELQATVTPAAGSTFETGRGRTGSNPFSTPLSSTGSHLLINPPAAGLVRIVDYLNFTGGTTITVGMNGSANIIPVTVASPIIQPGWVLAAGAGGLTFANTATGGNAYAISHDEAA